MYLGISLIGVEEQLILPVGEPCYITYRVVEELILPVDVPCYITYRVVEQLILFLGVPFYITNRGRGATYPACRCTLL